MRKTILTAVVITALVGGYYFNSSKNEEYTILKDINDTKYTHNESIVKYDSSNETIEKIATTKPNQARIDEVLRNGRLHNRTKQDNSHSRTPRRDQNGALSMEDATDALLKHMTFYDNTLFFDQQEQITFEESDFKNRTEILEQRAYAIFQLAPKDIMNDFFKSNHLKTNGEAIKHIQFPILDHENGELSYRKYKCKINIVRKLECEDTVKDRNIVIGNFYILNKDEKNFNSYMNIIENSRKYYNQYYELSDSGQFLIFLGAKK